MAIITQDGGQSSTALASQVIPYVKQLVAQQIQAATDQLIGTQLSLVLRDFYTKSTAWRKDVGPYNITTNPYVDLNPIDQNTRLQFVLAAWLFPYQGSNEPCPLWPLVNKPVGGIPQPPSRYYMETPDRMYLYPNPDQAYGQILYVNAVLVPLSTAVALPDMAYTHHLDGLLYGTLARLYAIPKRPWTDKTQAMEYEKKYRREILLARDMATRGYGPGSSIRFPAFAGRGGSQVLPRATG